MIVAQQLSLLDLAPTTDFADDVLKGLQAEPKTIPCKYLYDRKGSQLFEEICRLPEYYPTRTEMAIMRDHAIDMASALGPQCQLLEYGSGSCEKVRVLLDRLDQPVAYVPIDISRSHLIESATDLAQAYPEIDVLPVCADFQQSFQLPRPEEPPQRRVAFFPGSTIGNFEPAEAIAALRRMAQHCGRDGGLLIGVDLRKDVTMLKQAYDDTAGITAAFNLNILQHINRELDANFELDGFRHHIHYCEQRSRIEMHLESLSNQRVTVADESFHIAEGERIHTENSHKYSLEGFAKLAALAGWQQKQVWTDPQRLFSVQYLTAK